MPDDTPVTVLRRVYRTWRPPVGWWRLRGYAKLELGGVPLKFAGLPGTPNEWWALAARRREWEQPVVEAFANAVPRGGTVFDVGAWIGAYTMVAAKLVGPDGRVFAFEPDPVARRQLERNIALNDLKNVTIVSLALSDREGAARLSGGDSEARVGESGEWEVQTTSLPQFIAKEGKVPDVMKVDIEGGEVLLDRDSLRTVGKLFVEVHEPAFAEAGLDSQAFLADIAGARTPIRLEGNATNYNVAIV